MRDCPNCGYPTARPIGFCDGCNWSAMLPGLRDPRNPLELMEVSLLEAQEAE